MSLTRKQQAVFRPVVESAWLAHCAESGQPPNNQTARETWYREQLMSAAGISSTRDCNTTSGFDRLLVWFGQLAQNERIVVHAVESSERRARYVIFRQLEHLTELQGFTVNWHYVRGLYDQMNSTHRLPPDIADCPAKILRTVIQALDSHIRRLTRQKKRVAS